MEYFPQILAGSTASETSTMKAVEQQQPNSMDSSDSVTGGSEYAYRPLTTKHRRAGSTGTTGDEEYTTDEDELYTDEADCPGTSMHQPHPIMKSDLARAATDLFGYASKDQDENEEPTSLFDEDDGKFSPDRSTEIPPRFTYNEKLSSASGVITSRHRGKIIVAENNSAETTTKKPFDSRSNDPMPRGQETGGTHEFPSANTRPLDLRLESEQTTERSDQVSRVSVSDSRKNLDIRDCDKPRKSSSTSETTTNATTTEVQDEFNNAKHDEANKTKIHEEELPSPTTLLWEKTVAEVKEHAIAKLQDELKKAHDELKLKDEEVARLSRFRQEVEQEVEELTASLFQEAHNMVRAANTRQANAERLLEESRMKVEVLAAEVSALKTLVLTSTPARPNPHLHPQIDARFRSFHNSEDGQQGLFTKKHRRSPSHFNLKYGRENSPPDSPIKEPRTSLPSDCCSAPGERECWDRDREKERDRERERDNTRDHRERDIKDFGVEVDPRVHAEFLRWKSHPCVDKSDTFVARVFNEDIDLSLDFPNVELGTKVRQAVLDGIIFIEAVSEKNKLAFPKKCALLEAPRQCHYRMRLSDQENQWHCISQICRNRIIAVCDFLNYLRYVERGLVKSSVHDIYWEITRLRKEMVLARLGLALSS